MRLMRFTLPPLGFSCTRHSSMGAAAAVRSNARTCRSAPAAKIALLLMPVMAAPPNDSVASFAALPPLSMFVKTSVCCPSETYKRPELTATAFAPASDATAPAPFGIDGTEMLNDSTDESPSAAKRIALLSASDCTLARLVTNVAAVFDGLVGSSRSHCDNPLDVAA